LKRILALPFKYYKNTLKDSFSRKYLTNEVIQTNEDINQIKLCKHPTDKVIKYLICVDMQGYLTLKLIKTIKRNIKSRGNTNTNTNTNVDPYTDIFSEEKKVFPCLIPNWGDNSVWSLDYSFPYIAVGGNSKIAFIINIETEKITKLTGNKHNIPCVRFSPCGNFVATASVDEHIRIFDIYTSKCVKCIKPLLSDL